MNTGAATSSGSTKLLMKFGDYGSHGGSAALDPPYLRVLVHGKGGHVLERGVLVVIHAGGIGKTSGDFVFPCLAKPSFRTRVGEFLKLPRDRPHIRWSSKNNCIRSQKVVPSSRGQIAFGVDENV